MSKSDESYASLTGVLNEAVGNGNATLLLERIVFWNTRKKGGVLYQGRTWSYRTQAEWIKLAGLAERTGKRCWARLVESGFILTEMRMGGPLGNRKMMMHVALSDKTLALLDETHLQMAATKAELAIKDHAKTAQKEKSWAELHAEIHAGEDE
jgi:hypothetical protein